MKILYISDNNFFCVGVNDTKATYISITSKRNIKSLNTEMLLEYFPVVFIENIFTRLRVIEKIQSVRKEYGIMMRELSHFEAFKLGDVIYCPETYSSSRLIKLTTCSHRSFYVRLTRRELQVLGEIHNSNADIATRLNISEKTVSSHKMKIQEKLMFRSRNNMMICKLKATLDVSYFDSK